MALNYWEILVQGDYGWGGQLLPLLLIMGISYGISRKVRDMLFIQFPLTFVAKLLFPFFSNSFVVMSFALFIMNLIGSKEDTLAELKSAFSKGRDRLMVGADMVKQAKAKIDKDILLDKYADVRESLMRKYNR